LENAFLSGNVSQNNRSQFSGNASYNNDNEENDNSAVKINKLLLIIIIKKFKLILIFPIINLQLINEIRDLKRQVDNLKRENNENKERKTINGNFKNSLLNSLDNLEPENFLDMQEVK
jgi:hypothetical protein